MYPHIPLIAVQTPTMNSNKEITKTNTVYECQGLLCVISITVPLLGLKTHGCVKISLICRYKINK